MSCLETLLDRDVVLFLGAGASREAGLPLGDEAAVEIIEASCRALGVELPRPKHIGQRISWPRLEVVIDYLEQYAPGAGLSIVAAFWGIGISRIHRMLARRSRPGWLWLTTNFDNLIERSLELREQPARSITRPEEIAGLTVTADSLQFIVKLHGDSTSSDGGHLLGVNIRQILRRFPEDAAKSIANLARGKTVIFIGYGARDPDLSWLVRKIASEASTLMFLGRQVEPPEEIQTLMRLNPGSSYQSGGACAILAREMGFRKPREIRHGIRRWSARVAKWARQQDKASIGLALSEIFRIQGSKEIREIARRMLARVPDDGERYVEKQDIAIRLMAELGDGDTVVAIADQLGERLAGLRGDARLNAARVCARGYFRSGRYDRAASVLAESLTKPLAGSTPRPNVVEATYERGIALAHCGAEQIDEALQWLFWAVQMAETLGDRVLEARARLRLSVGLVRASRLVDAEGQLTKVLEVFREVGNHRGILDVQISLAETMRAGRRVEDAFKLNSATLHAALDAGEQEVSLSALNNLGLCEVMRGNLEEADILWHELSVRLVDNPIGDCLGHAVRNRGWLRICEARWGEAIPYLRDGAENYLRSGSRAEAGTALTMAGWAELRSNNDREAANAMLQRIEREKLIPSGTDVFELEMLRFALSPDAIIGENTIVFIRERFAQAPEQRFHLLFWLFEMCDRDTNPRTVAEIREAASVAAEESAIAPLSRLLQQAIERRGAI